jgi:predicted dehydrogenase
MPLRLAFCGFRHNHIIGLYQGAERRDDIEIVAACEADEQTAAALGEKGVTLTHRDYDAMLAEVDCDAVAFGDVYGARGQQIIAALQAGRHVIGDKPLCTRLDELDRIATLAEQKTLAVGCMLDLRGRGTFLAMRQAIADGAIGEVHTVTFLGQHPLLPQSRPGWYFQPGQQGGTINDIAIHALDLIPWMTGRGFGQVVAARAWNARAVPDFFQDGAQMMLTLDNNGGVLGDVSYLSAEGCGYAIDQYWRVTVHGSEGLIEGSLLPDSVKLIASAAEGPQPLAPLANQPESYLDDFLAEVAGSPNAAGLATPVVLAAARRALLVQQAGETGQTHIELP